MNIRITKPIRYIVKNIPQNTIVGVFDSPSEVSSVTGEKYTSGRLLTTQWDVTEVKTSVQI